MLDDDINVPRTQTAQPTMRDISFDELLDDTIGLSLKSIRSIYALFRRPIEYFNAAKQPFWLNHYSPSFRIYMALVTFSAAMKFFYDDGEDGMVKLYASQFDLVRDQLTDKVDVAKWDSTALALSTLKLYFLITPLLTAFLYLILGFSFFAYGEKLSAITRIRYVFAALIPASIVGSIGMIPMLLLSGDVNGYLNFVLLIAMFGAVWVTLYRGAFGAVEETGGRIWRSTLLTFLIATFMMLGAFIAVFVAMIITMKNAMPGMALPT